jgi:oxygen-independent coproporphyrinogen-3 oxidase
LDDPPAPDGRWASVYVGGGTPTLLEPRQLDQLLTAVAPRLVPGAEVTVEANPESLTAEHLAVLTRWGVNRLSLGIQSFNEDLLARHGRPTRRTHLDAAKELVARWPGQLSLDLICGLGGQTGEGQLRDLEEALAWRPDHLSWYSLTVEAGTPLDKAVKAGTAGLPSEDEAARWWLEGARFLESAGLPAYEVSNFGRPGAESEHNRRYWALEPWWGLGPSSVSFLPRAGGGFEYRTEAVGLGEWLAGAAPQVEVLSALELAKDRLLVGLRQTSGAAGGLLADLLPQTLARWRGRALADEDRLMLSPEAFPFLDAFLRDAFAELDGRPEFR